MQKKLPILTHKKLIHLGFEYREFDGKGVYYHFDKGVSVIVSNGGSSVCSDVIADTRATDFETRLDKSKRFALRVFNLIKETQ